MLAEARAGVAHVPAQRWSDGARCDSWQAPLAVELPVSLRFGGIPYAVMMATPDDLVDFATGFALTEGIIEAAGEIRTVEVFAGEDDEVGVDVTLAPGRFRRHLARKRQLGGRTSCGVCGIEDASALAVAVPRAAGGATPNRRAIALADAALRSHQPLHDRTRSVHGAAWCDLGGEILLVREDVGRHNALDKLIGAVLRGGLAIGRGFVLVTSRASFEMVEKTAVLGASTLAAVSAPTSLAVRRAQALGLTLVSTRGEASCVVYAGDLGRAPDAGAVLANRKADAALGEGRSQPMRG